MAQQIPAFKGNFGTTEFYVITMRAGEVIRNLTIPKNMEGWEDLSPEEKFQREVNYKRVAQHIAPYLATDEDRFIGAFIVMAMQDDEMEFESLVDAGAKFPKGMPNSLMSQFGVLYLSGSEVLVPLDGQHRLAALKFAIEGKDNKGKDLDFGANPKIAEDFCTIILISNDPHKSRKIFNKVNRYAKPTSKADNLITADDDYIAVLTREEIIGKLIDTRLVNITSNTLSPKSGFFTTLATVYEISLAYEETLIQRKPDISKLPPQADITLAKNNLRNFWTNLLEIDAYKSSVMNPEPEFDARRAEIRDQCIHCKPIAQRAIAEAICAIISNDNSDGSRTSIEEVVDRVNSLDWSPANPEWQGILMIGDKIITGNGAMKFAARILAYLLGQNLEKVEIEKLKEQFSNNTDGKSLPDPKY